MLEFGDAPVTALDSQRLQSLLAYLLLNRHAPQPRQRLAFLLWPDSTEAQAHTNLRKLLFLLRRTLPDADCFLSIKSSTLQWRSDSLFTLDVALFTDALDEAARNQRTGLDPAAEIPYLKGAINCYWGDLLPSLYDEWLVPQRESLHSRFIAASVRLVQLLEAQRDYPGAIQYAQRLVHHDPLAEAAYRDLIRLYALTGDRAAALRAYHSCASVLEHELGIAPSQTTREAYERLLSEDLGDMPLFAGTDPPASPTAFMPIVGRQHAWNTLQTAWRASARAEVAPQLFLLSGEAGIGKTRLAEELFNWVTRQGIASAAARCYAAEGNLVFAPIVSWLRARPLPHLERRWQVEIARLLPELLELPDHQQPAPLNEPWQRQRLFDAVAHALLSWSPLLLFLDDIQWCDQESIECLHYLLRARTEARLLVVATMRSEEAISGGTIGELLAALQREGQLIRVELDSLNHVETASLAANVLHRPLTDDETSILHRETEGNPLFILETLRAGPSEQGNPDSLIKLSGTMQSVLARRLNQLSRPARELVDLAATVGREFTFTILRAASDDDDDDLVRAVDELWQRRIVREQGDDLYDFSHDKLREVAYSGLSTARRRLLHRRVAEVLQTIHMRNLDSVSSQIAVHYDRAGSIREAVPFYRRAGQSARRVYANEEAIYHFRRAIELLATDTSDGALEDLKISPNLLEELGDVLELTGQHDEARVAYSQAMALLPDVDKGVSWGRLYQKVGSTLLSQSKYDEALETYRKAEALLTGNGDEKGRTDKERWQVWIDVQLGLGGLYYSQGDADAIAKVIERLGVVVEQCGTALQQSRFFQLGSMMALRRDRYVLSDDIVAWEHRHLASAQASGDPYLISDAFFRLGFTLLWHGDLDDAQIYLQTALKQAEGIGSEERVLSSLTYLTTTHRLKGHVSEARIYATRALDLATRLHSPTYVGAALGNLAWLAWRGGQFSKAIEYGRRALEAWENSSHPFRWLAVFPLVAALLSQDRWEEAVEYSKILFSHMQQQLPTHLLQVAGDAVQSWERGDQTSPRLHLARLIEFAHATGHI